MALGKHGFDCCVQVGAQPVVRPDGDVELPDGVLRRPDGDVELTDDMQSGFLVPPCPTCGGILKPNVVFFGDALPPERAAKCAPVYGGHCSYRSR